MCCATACCTAHRRKAARSALVIAADGNFRIINEGETSADTLVREGAWQVLTFGPALVKDGQVTVSSSDEVGAP